MAVKQKCYSSFPIMFLAQKQLFSSDQLMMHFVYSLSSLEQHRKYHLKLGWKKLPLSFLQVWLITERNKNYSLEWIVPFT